MFALLSSLGNMVKFREKLGLLSMNGDFYGAFSEVVYGFTQPGVFYKIVAIN
jgi:hypothetical protein